MKLRACDGLYAFSYFYLSSLKVQRRFQNLPMFFLFKTPKIQHSLSRESLSYLTVKFLSFKKR